MPLIGFHNKGELDEKLYVMWLPYGLSQSYEQGSLGS